MQNRLTFFSPFPSRRLGVHSFPSAKFKKKKKKRHLLLGLGGSKKKKKILFLPPPTPWLRTVCFLALS